MATLKISIDTKSPNTEVTQNIGQLRLNINSFVPVSTIEPSDLISTDTPNTLELGSDGKLSVPQNTLRLFNSKGKQIW